MPNVTISCPNTGKPLRSSVRVSSLLDIEKLGWEKRQPCEHCGEIHDLDQHTAFELPDRELV